LIFLNSLASCVDEPTIGRLAPSNAVEEVEMGETSVSETVKTLIQVIHDGHQGFTTIAEHSEGASAKRFFLSEATTRAKFEHELKHAAGLSEYVGGTAAGAVHWTWGDLKAHLGGGDHALLDTAEQEKTLQGHLIKMLWQTRTSGAQFVRCWSSNRSTSWSRTIRSKLYEIARSSC
jgi:hypothetical protein